MSHHQLNKLLVCRAVTSGSQNSVSATVWTLSGFCVCFSSKQRFFSFNYNHGSLVHSQVSVVFIEHEIIVRIPVCASRTLPTPPFTFLLFCSRVKGANKSPTTLLLLTLWEQIIRIKAK